MKFSRFKALVQQLFVPAADGSIQENYAKTQPRLMNPLVLAYVGDAYFHLYVRERLLSYEQSKVQILHEFSAQIVSAVWQAKAYYGIEAELTDEEKAIVKRGRNAKSHAPRSASVAEYHLSTGFEALLGTLYLQGEKERLAEIAEKSFQIIAKEMMQKIQEKSEA